MKALPVQQSERDPELGARLRNHRLRAHMTIEQLAGAAGLTKGFLSRVERDQTSPSVASLVKICRALRVPVGQLFEEPPTTVVRLAEAPHVDLGGTGIAERLVSAPELEGAQVIRASVAPGGEGEEALYTVECETELLHVISGSFLLRTAAGEHALGPGDTVTFSGREPHSWRSLGEEPAEVLWILLAP
ncbi:helix-turn-helix domain-containing protein [Rothia kristinae]|uniref:Helix-turn-helix transcriptional regulator n=1 Tax=Rothia kristinae TaxID=37923 RepID=A0A1S2N1H4_9MICC|nr:XRE family transcriptional regulator [Rothia kristinae]OIJ35551.1 XRE family transcriptional regulator [Rothia kristinae]QQC58499.1 helix-turn-helix transcriptional regulator [Rothia kristinae]